MASINLDSSSRLDITCRKGDKFNLTIEITGISAITSTASDFTMEVRESDTAAATTIASTSFTMSLATDSLTVVANPTTMAAVASGLYVYDLQYDNGLTADAQDVKTYLYGTFKVNEDVTV
tara:strand:- start:1217 stop:1579 length:363 start_codon:yes stop_codon:yes gene_type:complete